MHPAKFLQRGRAQTPTLSDAEKSEKLEALGIAIAEKRKEAIDARKASGIEDVWLSCEEAYLGIDDMNRAEFSNAKWAKPTSMSGPITYSSAKKDETRSNVFVPLTSRYVDGASSKLCEIILPIDDKAFKGESTPVPELVKQLENKTPLSALNGGQPIPKPPTEPAPPVPGQPPQPPQPPQEMTVADRTQMIIDAASKAAEKAETRIYDWMVESKYPAESRKVIKDAARIGVGILKGPIPEVKSYKAMSKAKGGLALQIMQEIKPVVRWVDPWNFFPADGCGENIHDGDGCCERDYLSSRKLKDLKKQEGYLKDQIDIVIEEGPGKVHLDGSNPADKKSKNRYEIWYYYGVLSREDLMLTNTISAEEEADKEEFHAIITLVNETVIRAIINPLDSGSFPYHVMSWRRRPGHWAGVGVSEQVLVPQRLVNAATRALLNNAGLSSGPQIIIDQLGITPADNSMTLYPGKIWYKTGESSSQNVRDSFLAVMIPSVEKEMQSIIQYGMRMAEEATSIPLVTQGQHGPTSPQTFGQAELQDNNALTWLRSIGYLYDDQITEPLVDALYEWLLLDPSVPDEEKGDFTFKCNGSSAMVERAIQEQTMMGLLGAAANPAFEIDPAKLMLEYLKSKRIDPRSVQLSDEDKAKRAQQQQPPAPVVQAAQIRAQADIQKLQMQGQIDGQMAHFAAMDDAKAASQDFQYKMQAIAQEAAHEQQLLTQGGTTPHIANATARMESAKITAMSRERQEQIKTDRDIAYIEKERQMAADNAQARHLERQDQMQLEMLKYATQQKISLETLKSQLAQTSMQEDTKRQLAQAQIALNQSENHQDRMVDVHKHNVDKRIDLHKHKTKLIADQAPPAPIEPAGKAPAGEAWQK